MKPWRLLDSSVVVDRPWLRLHRERLQLPSGVVLDEFHRIEGRAWAAVVALDTAGHVVMVDQYRRGLDAVSRELPAGVLEPAESPLEGAKRELLEETGYQATDWVTLPPLFPEPVRSSSKAHLFLARGAVQVGPQRLDQTEDLTVHLVPVADALAAALNGGIAHSTHVAALLVAERLGLLSPSGAKREP